MPPEYVLTLSVVHDGTRPEDVHDLTTKLTAALNAQQGMHAEGATRPGKAGQKQKGLDPHLGKLLVDLVSDPKVIAAFVSLLGALLRPRPKLHFEIEHGGKKVRITANDFSPEQMQQVNKSIEQLLKKKK